ncbi:MAG TPA: hypothetical protein VJ904_03440, partial [Tichowtungia sp.]|nr:hypothetical protein [Tichowtungia sp.]
GITSLRPQLMAFPQTNELTAVNGAVELNWILPKRREAELSQLTIKSLEPQSGTWSSDASDITGLNAGWQISSGGRSGDCWYSEQSLTQRGAASLLLKEVFVPDASAQLTFWQFARLYKSPFSIDISTDDGASYNEVYSAYSAPATNIYEYSWSSHSVPLAAYAGQPIQLRLRVENEGGYNGGDWPGIRLDDLAITSGDWYDWETFATDTTLASDRFSATNTLWDDCDDFSGFSVYSTSAGKEWAITNIAGVGSCFGIQPDGYGGTEYVTSTGTITPTASTRLLLVAKYYLSADPFRILVSTDRVSFTEIWSATGSLDWGDIAVDLSAYAGQAIYLRLEYVPGSYYPDTGGVWIDSISTEEVANPELEGQPVYTTALTGLAAGTNTLAAVLTDTNGVDHAVGPAFTLTVSGSSG